MPPELHGPILAAAEPIPIVKSDQAQHLSLARRDWRTQGLVLAPPAQRAIGAGCDQIIVLQLEQILHSSLPRRHRRPRRQAGPPMPEGAILPTSNTYSRRVLGIAPDGALTGGKGIDLGIETRGLRQLDGDLKSLFGVDTPDQGQSIEHALNRINRQLRDRLSVVNGVLEFPLFEYTCHRLNRGHGG